MRMTTVVVFSSFWQRWPRQTPTWFNQHRRLQLAKVKWTPQLEQKCSTACPCSPCLGVECTTLTSHITKKMKNRTILRIKKILAIGIKNSIEENWMYNPTWPTNLGALDQRSIRRHGNQQRQCRSPPIEPFKHPPDHVLYFALRDGRERHDASKCRCLPHDDLTIQFL